MSVGSGPSHVVARRAIDEIAEFSGETKTLKYMKILMYLRDSRRMGNGKLMGLNESIVAAEEEISTLEAHLKITDAAINSE
ncbi:hypothetical protein Tco_1242104 [Tanacetum coccineum]